MRVFIPPPLRSYSSGRAWVEVEGVLTVRDREGDRLVSIQADRVVLAEEPVNPYLPPVY